MKNITFNKISTITLSAALVLSSCSTLFESKVPMGTSGSIASLSNLIVPEVEIEQLDAPKQIFVSQAEYNDSIIVTWSAVTGATSYRVERAVSTTKDASGKFVIPAEDDFELLPLASRVYSTNFTDRILTSPSYLSEEYDYGYFYRVSAENPRLKYESSDFITSEEAYLLAPPKNTNASLGDYTDHITVQWDKTPKATAYEVWRASNSDGSSAIKKGSVTANQNWFNDSLSAEEQGKDFYYYIIAKTSSSSSVTSSIALGYGLLDGAPSIVKDVKVTEGKGRGDTTDSIEITWTALTSPGINYAVYRTSSKDSSYTLLKQGITTTSCKDNGPFNENEFYYYQVQAYKEKTDSTPRIKGPFSASGKNDTNPAEGYILAPPASVSISKNINDPSVCTFTFAPAIGSLDASYESKFNGANKYNSYSYVIYGGTDKNSVTTKLTTITDSSVIKNDEGNYIYDYTNSGSYKFFKITTENSAAVSSNPSDVCAPVPFAAINVTATKASNIPGYTDSSAQANDNGVFPVKITWTPSLQNDADGGYFIYRSTKENSGFKKITESPVTETSYVDYYDLAKAGTYYYYRILALNELNQGANYSTSELGYGALTAEQYMREYNKTVMASQKKLKLMHMADDMKKLGSETGYGKLSGSLSYDASVAGLGARILMHYTNYAEYYANGSSENGFYFLLNGDTNTSASMDASGTMDGTVTCSGMYPGSVSYGNIKIKGGGAAGGSYGIKRAGFDGQVEVSWTVGEEGK